MRRRLIRIALILGLIVQIGHAVPARAVAGLRAVTCCARGCDHGRSLSDAMRCCGVQVGDQLGATPPGGSLMPTFVAHALGEPTLGCEPVVAWLTRPIPPHDRPPPVFLLVRSLRL